jgi:hypothetical protein
MTITIGALTIGAVLAVVAYRWAKRAGETASAMARRQQDRTRQD